MQGNRREEMGGSGERDVGESIGRTDGQMDIPKDQNERLINAE